MEAGPKRPRNDGTLCGSNVEAFLCAGRSLLHANTDLPDEILDLCRSLLEANCRGFKASPLVDILASEHAGPIEEMLDSKTVCRVATTARRVKSSLQWRLSDDRYFFDWIVDWPQTVSDLISPYPPGRYHSPLMLAIINGYVDIVAFIAQLGVDVNRKEACRYSHPACDLCSVSGSLLYDYTFYEVACSLAKSPGRPPSERRKQIFDILKFHGGVTQRAVMPKRWFLRRLRYGSGSTGGAGCRIIEAGLLDDSSDNE